MLGLFDTDCLIRYVDFNYAVVNNPTDNNVPTIVKRNHGDPNREEVCKIIHRLGLSLDGESFYRKDGLWCNRLKSNGNGAIYG